MTANAIDSGSSDRKGNWVCLVYHDVFPSTTASGGGPERFAVPLPSFERTLDLIHESGRRGCSVADALARGGDRSVGITFDDGRKSNFDHAAPALHRRGMSATFYVTTDWVGTPGFMSWDELRTLKDWGMSVQSHTRSHPFLSELNEHDARAEFAGSKAALDRMLNQETVEIALPGGDAPSRALRGLFSEVGYSIVSTSRWGLNGAGPPRAGPRYVRRCTVRADVPRDTMLRIIEADPWLALRRSASETARGRLRSLMGASRYARWRGRFLDALAGFR